jgi:uncharacterized membrane protein YdjX (TVP38/TMEM64 family)
VHERGTAYGLYHLASGLLVLPGAVLFGAIWERFGSSTAFTAAAIVTALGAAWMSWLARGPIAQAGQQRGGVD